MVTHQEVHGTHTLLLKSQSPREISKIYYKPSNSDPAVMEL